MSLQPTFETIDEAITRLWAQGLNTFDITVAVNKRFGETFHESAICRVLHSVERLEFRRLSLADRRKGGAE